MRQRALAGWLIIAAGLVAFACSEGSSKPEKVGETRANIRAGVDSDDTRVVYLWGSNGYFCSGVLVSPAFVMTAAHCFIGHNGLQGFGASSGMGIDVPSVSIGSGAIGPNEIARYTRGLHGPGHVVRVLDTHSKVNTSGTAIGSVKNDIALVPLDHPLFGRATAPIGTVCTDGITGDFFGYGQREVFDLILDPTARQDGIVQRRGTREFEREEDVFVTELPAQEFLFGNLPLIGDILSALGGGNAQIMQAGDSGGPLFGLDGQGKTQVCGITSRPWVDWECGFGFPDIYSCQVVGTNHFAAVDRSDVISWYTPVITDAAGRLKGTCNVGTGARAPFNTVDSDGDTIPDACDPCPHKADTDYDQSTTPDADLDGIPDRCDLCPAFADALVDIPTAMGAPARIVQPDADLDTIGDACDLCVMSAETPPPTVGRDLRPSTNCNLETEISVNYPGLGLTAPPMVFFTASQNQFGESYADAAARWHDAFRGDACDNAPCPALQLDSGDFTSALPAGTVEAPECLIQPGQSCAPELTNVIAHAPVFAPPLASLTAFTQTMWCSCAANNTEAERRACAERADDPCLALPAKRSSNAWHDIRTRPFPNPVFDAPDIWTSVLATSGAEVRREYWDFTALGAPFLQDLNGNALGNLTFPIKTEFGVQGVLWNGTLAVFNIANFGDGSPAAESVRNRGSALTSGSPSLRSVVGGKPWPFTPQADPLPTHGGCLSCPFENANLYAGRPPFYLGPNLLSDFERLIMTPSGWAAVNPGRSDIFRDRFATFLAEPGNWFRASGDLFQLVGDRYNSLGGAVRGVAMDAAGHVVGVVKAEGFSSDFVFSDVTSASRAELFAATDARAIKRLATPTQLAAIKTYSPIAASLDSTRTFGALRDLLVPEEISVVSGNAGNQIVRLTFLDSTAGSSALAFQALSSATGSADDRDRHGHGHDGGHRKGHCKGKGRGHEIGHGHGHDHDGDCDDHDNDGEVVCQYRGGSRRPHPTDPAELSLASEYRFVSCDNGSKPGDVIPSDGVTLHVADGDTNQPNTTVEVTIQEKPAEEGPLTCEQVDLIALAPISAAPVPGKVDLGETRRFALPTEIQNAIPTGCGSSVRLSFRESNAQPWTTCRYRFSDSDYAFAGCTPVMSAGQPFYARELMLDLDTTCGRTEAAQLTLAELEPCGDVGPGRIVDREGAIFSAARGELYVIGNEYGYSSPDAWVYTLARGRWQHIPLEGGSGVANVIAATYVAAERAMYFVENPSGFGMRLGRWDTVSGHVDFLGLIAWGFSDERAWLTQSLDGKLIFATSPYSYSDPSYVYILYVEGENFSMERASRNGKIFGTPLADSDGVSIDLATGGTFEDVRQSRLRYDDFEEFVFP